MDIKKLLYKHLFITAWPRKGLSPVNKFFVFMIILSVLSFVLETEAFLYERFSDIFSILNYVFGILFTIEYVCRLYSIGLNENYVGFKGRLKYIFSFTALIDLLAILPFYFAGTANEGYVLRVFRLFRMILLARLGRYSKAMQHLKQAFTSRSHELILSFSIAFFMLIFSATLLYLAEGVHQPEVFGSIPRSLWWSIVTLTTVGYGDAYPITLWGKIFAGFTAFTSIGLIAMPTGILAASFSDSFQKIRQKK